MDNLEYFNGTVPPSILENFDKNEDTGAQNKENDNKEEKTATTEKDVNGDKRLPMPPINTNFKGITAAALVASRRKVFRIFIYDSLKCEKYEYFLQSYNNYQF